MRVYFILFLVLLYVAGIDSAFSYIEAMVANILDYSRLNITTELDVRMGVTGLVCAFGVILSAFFTTSYGWILLDLVDHYISNYIIISVGIM